MKKRILGGMIAFFMLVGSVPTMANTVIRAYYGDGEIIFDQPPIIENGRTLVPVRAIMETLGLDLEYDQKTQIIKATGDGHEILMKIGETTARVDGEIIHLDVPAKIVNSRTLVPLRFIGEALGLDVVWDAPSRMIYLDELPEEAPILDPVPPLAPVTEPTGEKQQQAGNATVEQVQTKDASRIFSYLGKLSNGLSVSKSGAEGVFFDSTDYYDAPDFAQVTGLTPIGEYHFMEDETSIYVFNMKSLTQEALNSYVVALTAQYGFSYVDSMADGTTGITSEIFANSNCVVVLIPVEAEGLYGVMLTADQGNRILGNSAGSPMDAPVDSPAGDPMGSLLDSPAVETPEAQG